MNARVICKNFVVLVLFLLQLEMVFVMMKLILQHVNMMVVIVAALLLKTNVPTVLAFFKKLALRDILLLQ